MNDTKEGAHLLPLLPSTLGGLEEIMEGRLKTISVPLGLLPKVVRVNSPHQI